MIRSRRTRVLGALPRVSSAPLALAVALAPGCQTGPEPSAIPLVDRFGDARVEGTAPPESEPPRIEWRFDDEPGSPAGPASSTRGWTAIHDVRGPAVREGSLVPGSRRRSTTTAPTARCSMPEVMARLAETLEAWHQEALASRVAVDSGPAEVSEDELEKLRALGYVN